MTNILAKLRTIHDLQELNGFSGQLLKDDRMTEELRSAIAVRRVELERVSGVSK